jgi:hypothetical protein
MSGRKSGSILRELQRTVEQARVLDTRRDNLIREALDADVPAKDLAKVIGVTVQRVYQLRGRQRLR